MVSRERNSYTGEDMVEFMSMERAVINEIHNSISKCRKL